MIYRITGRLTDKSPSLIVIDVNGIAYEVNVPLSTYDSIGKAGEEVSLYTILAVGEEDLRLYGFLTQDERKLFRLLTSVSGIGPRTALSVLSSADVNDIYSLITDSNVQALTSIPGIGKKTAERVVFELRDKIRRLDIGVDSDRSGGKEEIRAEAVEALVALGYSRLQSERAIREVIKNDSSNANAVETLVRAALKEVK